MGIRRPDVNLDVGSGSQAWQTAEILKSIEPVLVEQNPDIALVVGDVNSTMAASLAAAKFGIPIAHVEAGLRSFDRSMPEEINRVVTDAVADYLFVTEEGAVKNLLKEGHSREQIHPCGQRHDRRTSAVFTAGKAVAHSRGFAPRQKRNLYSVRSTYLASSCKRRFARDLGHIVWRRRNGGRQITHNFPRASSNSSKTRRPEQ